LLLWSPVTFRITLDRDSEIQIVRIAGWLESEDVAELERVVSDTSGRLRLDLTELRSADQTGVTLLKALRACGVSFVGASPFIRLLLATEPSRPPPEHRPDREGRKT
jgi:hypothetical protein